MGSRVIGSVHCGLGPLELGSRIWYEWLLRGDGATVANACHLDSGPDDGRRDNCGARRPMVVGGWVHGGACGVVRSDEGDEANTATQLASLTVTSGERR